MTKTTFQTPTEISDAALDDVNGGPHFRTSGGEIYTDIGTADLDVDTNIVAEGASTAKARTSSADATIRKWSEA